MTKSESRDGRRDLRSAADQADFSGFVIPHSYSILRHALLLVPSVLMAATNSGVDEIPPLRPPQSEIPPGFWEQHGLLIVSVSVLLLALVCVAVWFLRRSRPQAIVPADLQARQALEPLRARAEDGFLLSQVSQILRAYINTAFNLSPNEATTTEFCDAIATNEAIGTDLSSSISDFLRRSDERKFAPSADNRPLEAVIQALKFIDACEARLALLRTPAQNSEAHKS